MRGHSSTRRSWPEVGQHPALQMSICRRVKSFTDVISPLGNSHGSESVSALIVAEPPASLTLIKVPFSTCC